MTDASADHARMVAALKLLIDDRDPQADLSGILVTLEGLVAATLLFVMQGDHRNASAMMHEGLLPGVESRLALAAQAAVQRFEQ